MPGAPRMLWTQVALLKSLEAAWTQRPWKISPKCDLLSSSSVSYCVFFIIVFTSEGRLIGVTLLRTMKREFSLIAKLNCMAMAPGLWESCTTFKPHNFPETTMQLYHKTFDWKHATYFSLLHKPIFGPLNMAWTTTHPQNAVQKQGINLLLLSPSFSQIVLYSHLPYTSVVVSTWLHISCSVFLFKSKIPS